MFWQFENDKTQKMFWQSEQQQRDTVEAQNVDCCIITSLDLPSCCCKKRKHVTSTQYNRISHLNIQILLTRYRELSCHAPNISSITNY